MFGRQKPVNKFDEKAAVEYAVFKVIEARELGREWVAESYLRRISGAKNGEPLSPEIVSAAMSYGIQIS